MRVSPFSAGYIGEQIAKAANSKNQEVFKKTKKDIEDAATTGGASSKEEKRYSPEYGQTLTVMEEAKRNIGNRRLRAAGMDAFGGLKKGATAKTFAEVSGENRDMRSPEQKAKDIAAASAGRSNADIAASSPAPSTASVMQSDESSQGAFGQAKRTGSLSSRGAVKVGRSYHDPERAMERFNRRNEQASRLAYGF